MKIFMTTHGEWCVRCGSEGVNIWLRFTFLGHGANLQWGEERFFCRLCERTSIAAWSRSMETLRRDILNREAWAEMERKYMPDKRILKRD